MNRSILIMLMLFISRAEGAQDLSNRKKPQCAQDKLGFCSDQLTSVVIQQEIIIGLLARYDKTLCAQAGRKKGQLIFGLIC